MTSETDYPRQRTVAELLAEHGGAPTGRRRRRRAAEEEDQGAAWSVAVATPVATDLRLAEPDWPEPLPEPDRSVLREPVPDDPTVGVATSWDTPAGNGFAELAATEAGFDPGPTRAPEAVDAPALPSFRPQLPPARPPRVESPTEQIPLISGGLPAREVGRTGPMERLRRASSKWQDALDAVQRTERELREAPGPERTAERRSAADRSAERRSAADRTAEPLSGPHRTAERRDLDDDGGPPTQAGAPLDLADGGPPTQASTPFHLDERVAEADGDEARWDKTRWNETHWDETRWAEADWDEEDQDGKDRHDQTRDDEAWDDEDRDDEDRDDEDWDDKDRSHEARARPAGLDASSGADQLDLQPRRRLGRAAAEAATTSPAWALVLAQWVVGALGGAALWIGFRFLWRSLPVVAITAAALVTLGLIVLVRALLRSKDWRTTGLAVLVGLLLTVSPAVLVLLDR